MLFRQTATFAQDSLAGDTQLEDTRTRSQAPFARVYDNQHTVCVYIFVVHIYIHIYIYMGSSIKRLNIHPFVELGYVVSLEFVFYVYMYIYIYIYMCV